MITSYNVYDYLTYNVYEIDIIILIEIKECLYDIS